ncbi:MAG: inositol monophosphatase [Haloferacaceae archaeon]
MPSPDRLAAVAERAARAGGDYLRGEFRSGAPDAEHGPDDATAAADRAAERRVLDVIGDAFPTHATDAEESGRRAGDGSGDRYEWLIDPLDGTNNFVAGIPAFATAVAVREDGDPVAAAVHEPLPGTLYRASRGGGTTVDGAPASATAGGSPALEHGTVSLVIGLEAVRDGAALARARAAGRALRERCKRVRETWAPAVDWGLLAAGRIEGVVAVRPGPYEHHAGALLAAESGAASGWVDDERYVAAPTPETRRSLAASLPE